MTYILTKVYESRQGINCEFTPSDCIESGEGKTDLDRHAHRSNKRGARLQLKLIFPQALQEAFRLIAA